MVVLNDVREHQLLIFATIKILLAMFATIKGRSVGLRPSIAVQGFEGWCSTRFPRLHLPDIDTSRAILQRNGESGRVISAKR